jgi:hypothetical protein
MLRFTDGWEVTIINTLGIWYALVSRNGKSVTELVVNYKDRDQMVSYARSVMSTMGVEELN